MLLPNLEPLDFAQNTLFLANSNVSKERGGIPSHKFFSNILLILLEDVFGWFSKLTNLEPFRLEIAQFAFQAKDRDCSGARARKL